MSSLSPIQKTAIDKVVVTSVGQGHLPSRHCRVYCHLVFREKIGKRAAGHLEDFQMLKQAKSAERIATAIRK